MEKPEVTAHCQLLHVNGALRGWMRSVQPLGGKRNSPESESSIAVSQFNFASTTWKKKNDFGPQIFVSPGGKSRQVAEPI